MDFCMSNSMSNAAEATHSLKSDKMVEDTKILLTKIQLASDLHLEFLPSDYSNWNEIIEPKAEILCLLGDIGMISIESERNRLLRFLAYCCDSFQKVLFISGNHEYYNSGIKGDEIMCMDDIDQVLYSFEDIFNGKFKYLNSESIIIDGVLFLGTTLWSEMLNTDCKQVVEGFLKDYKVIFKENKTTKISSTQTHELFIKNKKWLIDNIESNNGKLPICVLTHHTPSLTNTSNPIYNYEKNHPNFYVKHGFSSNMDELLTNNDLRVWAYGHTHYNNIQYRNRTLLLSNQHGYNVNAHIDNYKRSLVVGIFTDRAEVF